MKRMQFEDIDDDDHEGPSHEQVRAARYATDIVIFIAKMSELVGRIRSSHGEHVRDDLRALRQWLSLGSRFVEMLVTCVHCCMMIPRLTPNMQR